MLELLAVWMIGAAVAAAGDKKEKCSICHGKGKYETTEKIHFRSSTPAYRYYKKMSRCPYCDGRGYKTVAKR